MGPTPKYGRNLMAVSAHFRRAGAFRDSRIKQLERVAEAEIEEAQDDALACCVCGVELDPMFTLPGRVLCYQHRG